MFQFAFPMFAEQMSKQKPHIIIDDKIPFIKGILEPYATVRYLSGAAFTAADVKDADALIIRTRTKINSGLLQNSKVQFIATATIGHDHIDKAYCQKNGINWTNAPGCNAESVNQYVLSALASLSNKYKFCLKGKTIGIVGVGNVGSKVANSAKALGMNVLLNDPPREAQESSSQFVSIEQIKKEADIITFHVPYINAWPYKTDELFDMDFMYQLKAGCYIINSSRGEVCNVAALKHGIKKGLIKSAVLDVWQNEPTIDRELLEQVFIATPHIAGYSVDGKANGTAMSVQAISKHFGFNLNNWKPNNLPLPKQPVLIPDKQSDFESSLKSILLATYPVNEDDARLRLNPNQFEAQRGAYPPRREYGSYRVKASEFTQYQKNQLVMLGFQLA